jgi:3-oxoadipate enol-lactonase
MGGMVGQWLGANAAGRIDKLILSNTACYYPDKQIWADRIKFARNNGIAVVAGATMERWFSKDFRQHAPASIARMTEMFVKTDIEGYLSCCEAIRDMDHRALLPKIKAPTLVIAGRLDPATPLALNEFICDHIPGAQLLTLEAAHIANVEQPQAYADAVLGFLLSK